MTIFSNINGNEANMTEYAELLKKLEELAIRFVDTAPVQMVGQLERAELVLEMVIDSKLALKDEMTHYSNAVAA